MDASCDLSGAPADYLAGTHSTQLGQRRILRRKTVALFVLAWSYPILLVSAGGPVVTGPPDGNVFTTDPIPGPSEAPIPARFLAPSPAVAAAATAVNSSGCPQTCLNGGTAVVRSSAGGCECQCPTSASKTFTGDSCQIVGNKCNSLGFYCANGGTCVAPASNQESWSCQCPAPFYGFQCLDAGVVCGSTLCVNGGTCQANQCSCPAGFAGADCSQAGTVAAAGVTSVFSSSPTTASGESGMKWYVILIITLGCVAGAAALLALVLLVGFRKNNKYASRSFRQQMQELIKEKQSVEVEMEAGTTGENHT